MTCQKLQTRPQKEIVHDRAEARKLFRALGTVDDGLFSS